LPEALVVKTHIFGRTAVFKYLEVLVKTDKVVSKEIQVRLKAGNICYYALQAVLKSRRISRKVKLNIYKTVIRPIVTYACETWVLTRKDELKILIWERKVLRRIFEPVCERGCYRIRTNEEVNRIYKEMDLVTIIKTLRLKWLGHVNRMEDQRERYRAFLGVGEGEENQERGGWMMWNII
jgi:hypothetical protein